MHAHARLHVAIAVTTLYAYARAWTSGGSRVGTQHGDP